MEIRLLDVAQHELDEAIEYYNAESPGLGDQFLLEVLSAFDRIRRFPNAGIRTQKIAVAARREAFRTPSSIKSWNLKSSWLPSPIRITDPDIGATD